MADLSRNRWHHAFFDDLPTISIRKQKSPHKPDDARRESEAALHRATARILPLLEVGNHTGAEREWRRGLDEAMRHWAGVERA